MRGRGAYLASTLKRCAESHPRIELGEGGRAPRIAGTPISVGEVLARLHVHGSVPAVVGRYGDVSEQQVMDAISFAGMFMELACAGRRPAE